MKVKINSEGLAIALDKSVGDIVEIKEKNGVPLVKEWRNRLKDAVIDDCVTVVTEKKKESK